MSEGDLRGNWEMQGNKIEKFNNWKGRRFEIKEARGDGQHPRMGCLVLL